MPRPFLGCDRDLQVSLPVELANQLDDAAGIWWVKHTELVRAAVAHVCRELSHAKSPELITRVRRVEHEAMQPHLRRKRAGKRGAMRFLPMRATRELLELLGAQALRWNLSQAELARASLAYVLRQLEEDPTPACDRYGLPKYLREAQDAVMPLAVAARAQLSRRYRQWYAPRRKGPREAIAAMKG